MLVYKFVIKIYSLSETKKTPHLQWLLFAIEPAFIWEGKSYRAIA